MALKCHLIVRGAIGLKQAHTGVVNERNEARYPSAIPELGFTHLGPKPHTIRIVSFHLLLASTKRLPLTFNHYLL